MKIVSWNVNSVRARIQNILDYIKQSAPDILMLQEIKNILKDYTNKEIVFNEAHNQLCDLHNVMLEGIVLKPNMVIPGLNCVNQADVDEVAKQKEYLIHFNITIRTHKVLPWEELKKYSKLNDDMFNHFKISKNSEKTSACKKLP